MPRTPPQSESRTFSVRNWRTNRPRPAPSEARTATSRSRDTPRASDRFAEVRAADQQHKAGGREQDQEAGAKLRSDECVGVPLDDDSPALVRLRKVFLDACPDRVHVCLGLLERHAVLEPGERDQPMKVAGHVRWLEGQGPPHLRERAIEGATGRQYANDDERLVVEEHRATDDRSVRAELADPHSVAQDNHLVLAALILVREKRAPERRPDTEDVEEAGGHARSAKLDRILPPRQGHRTSRLGRHEVEDGVVLLPVQEVQRRDAVAFTLGRLLEHPDDAVGVLVGQWPEKETIHKAEDRRVGANAEGKRQQRHCCESGAVCQGSPGVPQVLKQ